MVADSMRCPEHAAAACSSQDDTGSVFTDVVMGQTGVWAQEDGGTNV